MFLRYSNFHVIQIERVVEVLAAPGIWEKSLWSWLVSGKSVKPQCHENTAEGVSGVREIVDHQIAAAKLNT